MANQSEITYSTGETAKITGASQKQIRYWESRGFINQVETSVAVSPTAGSRRTRSRLSVLSKGTWFKGILWRGLRNWP